MPRKLWLETYSPELTPEPSAEKTALLASGNVVGELARQLYGGGLGTVVSFERGLRAAIDATRALVARGGSEPIFEATFDHDGVSVRIDILIEVKTSRSSSRSSRRCASRITISTTARSKHGR